jgi:inosine/xanthosine triphosphatase
MQTIIVASQNPVKIQAVREGFSRMFPGERYQFQGISVPSGVSVQPITSAETLQGAYNRACNARACAPKSAYWVGIEGGIEETSEAAHLSILPGAAGEESSMVAFAWVVVLAGQQIGKGRTGVFFLPPRVADLVRQGKELGEADDIVFGRSNSKQENGAVGLLTGNIIDRAAFYEQAVILALIPFSNPQLYTTNSPEVP